MERFWNIVHYFAYRADCKLTYCFYKYTGCFKLYDIPFIRRRLKDKFDINDPVNFLLNLNNKPNIGLSSIFAFLLVVGGQFFFILGLFMCFPNKKIPVEYYIVCMGGVVFFNYIWLLHKDKYLRYFKKFDKKSYKWKVKWAWISLGVILFLYGFLLFSGLVLNPYFRSLE